MVVEAPRPLVHWFCPIHRFGNGAGCGDWCLRARQNMRRLDDEVRRYFTDNQRQIEWQKRIWDERRASTS